LVGPRLVLALPRGRAWSRSTGTSPRAEAVLAFFVGSVLIFLIVLSVGFFLAGS
jgi:hypothetical protein